MKAKLFFIFFLGLSFNSYAIQLNELKDLYDSTFSRDNSFCHYNKHNFELQIRSLDRYSDSNDRDYGEYPFLNQQGTSYKINFNAQDIGRYRFIYAKEKECTKTLSIPYNAEEINLLWAQDSRPYPDQLVIMRYNPSLRAVTLLDHTKVPILDYYRVNDTVIFSSYIPKTEMSTLDYDGLHYSYISSALPVWRIFDGNIVQVDTKITFNEFEWKKYFKNLDEFKKEYQWDEKEKTFQKNNFELIINSLARKRCLKIASHWRCQSF